MSDNSEKHQGRVRALWYSLPDLCSHAEATLKVRLSPVDLILALMEATGEEFAELAVHDWTGEKIVSTIQNTALFKNLPIVDEEVELSESAIPQDVFRSLYEETVKSKGEKWVVHKNDADPFPSDPHAHNYDAGLKLHLGNGDLYQGTKKVGTMPAKRFKDLRELFKRIKMPPLEIKE